MKQYHDATFYVQVDAEWGNWPNQDGDRPLRSIKAVAITQKRPTKQRPGTVLTKLTLRMPESAFLPLRPEAVIVVPDTMTSAATQISVEAEDPQQ